MNVNKAVNINSEAMVALIESWCAMTAYPKCRDSWSSKNPSLGQCAVTALLIQDYFGGIIKFSQTNNHFFNQINGEIIDYTIGQFSITPDISDAKEWTRRMILFGEGAERAETFNRYHQLLFRFSGRYEELRSDG
jgi:hypothetical protein